MSHGKIECDYIDDFISGKLFLDSFPYNHLMQKSCTVKINSDELVSDNESGPQVHVTKRGKIF